MNPVLTTAQAVRERIRSARPSVYDPPVAAGSELSYTPDELCELLRTELVGRDDFAGLPVRTRSKVAKSTVCEVLGYAAPTSFLRCQPRFPHPNMDLYVQKSNNLQIWNEEVDGARRYVIIILNADDVVTDVKVIAGADLAAYDGTGTLTSKFQANRLEGANGSKLVSQQDTSNFRSRLRPGGGVIDLRGVSSVEQPIPGRVLSISELYSRLLPMVNETYSDPGVTRERIRGTAVHRRVCELLGLADFADNGQFPDVMSQGLEVKLQLARTIDLGLELPNSDTPLASLNGVLAPRDVRYAIFYGERVNDSFTLTSLVLTTGEDFFAEFRQFGGKVSNAKLQLRLPVSWF